MRKALDLVRRLVIGRPEQLARKAQRAEWLAGDPELQRFADELRVDARRQAVIFGHVKLRGGTSRPVGLPLERITATHISITGASGSGKTTVALDVTEQMLRLPRMRIVTVDPKGDFFRDLRENRFPILAQDLGAEFANRVRYIRPFAGEAPLRLTAPEPGVSIQVQARSLGTTLAEASGIELTPPAVSAFTKLAQLAIELGQPLTAMVTWIARPDAFAREAQRSSDDHLRHYGTIGFAREHRGMLRALQGRLEGVLLLPTVRAALEAPTCVSMVEALEHHHLLIDLSDPPAGEEAAVRMLGAALVGRLTRGILNRRVSQDTPHVLLAIDELPEILSSYDAASVGRLAALARSRKVSVATMSQQRVQLGAKLSDILRTNAGIELAFRCNAADAETLAHVLPISPDARRPGDERRALVRRMVSLPRRHFLFWVKDGAVPAHFVRARKVDGDVLRQKAAAVPESVRAALGAWPDEPRPSSESKSGLVQEPLPLALPEELGAAPSDSEYPGLG